MVHYHYTYLIDGYRQRIPFGRGRYHRLHFAVTDPKYHAIMYLPDDKLKECTKEELKELYDKNTELVNEKKLLGFKGHGEIMVREGAFIRCFDNDEMIGFLHISEKMTNDLKDRLTAEFITNAAKEIFEQDADFGLYYCGSLCPPEAKFADYYFNWSGLEIKKVEETSEDQSLEEKESLSKMEQALQEKETALQECQKSLYQMTKNNDKLEDKVKKLEEMEETRKREIQQLEEEVKKLKEQQQKMTIDDEMTGQYSTA